MVDLVRGHLAQVAILLKVTVKQSQTRRSPARFLVAVVSCFYRSVVSLMDSVRLSQQTLSRRFSFPISHSTHLQMPRFRISRLTHIHRPSRTQVLLFLAALILPCVPPLVMSQAMASRHWRASSPRGFPTRAICSSPQQHCQHADQYAETNQRTHRGYDPNHQVDEGPASPVH